MARRKQTLTTWQTVQQRLGSYFGSLQAMQGRSLLIVIVVSFIGCLYSLQQLATPVTLTPTAYAQTSPQVKSVSAEQPTTLVSSFDRSEPTRITIPSLQIDASVVGVGQDASGNMSIPSGDKAGWYDGSPTPGEIGPSIIVGHVHSPTKPSIFWRLRELKPGDVIDLARADGKTISFKVDYLKLIKQNELSTSDVYQNLDYAGIRLITCGGTFDKATQSYSHNTVVYGSVIPVSVTPDQPSLLENAGSLLPDDSPSLPPILKDAP